MYIEIIYILTEEIFCLQFLKKHFVDINNKIINVLPILINK